MTLSMLIGFQNCFYTLRPLEVWAFAAGVGVEPQGSQSWFKVKGTLNPKHDPPSRLLIYSETPKSLA